jgi:small subunit ribosomal protein S18
LADNDRGEAMEGAREEGNREDRGARPAMPGGQRRYFPRRRVCAFCVERAKTIDYKDVPTLERYVTDQGKMRGRRQTGNCAKHQHMLSRAIKRARQIALLPYSHEHSFTS